VERISQSEVKNLEKDVQAYVEDKKKAENNPVNRLYPLGRRIRAATSNSKRVSRVSMACLYLSILFATYSRLADKGVLPPSPSHPKIPHDLEILLHLHEEEEEGVYAAAICQIIGQLVYVIDTRNRLNPSLWTEIFKVKEEHGYRAASSFTRGFSAIRVCNNCRRDLTSVSHRLTRAIDQRTDSKDMCGCEFCGTKAAMEISAPISVNTIKKREYEVKLDQIYLEAYSYYFMQYLKWIENNMVLFPKFIQIFKDEFCIQEAEATKHSFLKGRYWSMLHYDKAKKRKRSHYLSAGDMSEISDGKVRSRKPHSIMEVKIEDQQYWNLVKQLVAAKDILQRNKLFSAVTSRLQEIGWPESIISRRVRTDVCSVG
jgi:hypothetical protein